MVPISGADGPTTKRVGAMSTARIIDETGEAILVQRPTTEMALDLLLESNGRRAARLERALLLQQGEYDYDGRGTFA